MPPAKRQQSSAVLYTLITFVGLFFGATTIAVIYYVKAEEYRTTAAALEGQIDDLANSRERQAIGTIVGTKPSNKSWLTTMTDYLDQMVSIIAGGVPEPTSAEVKVKNASTQVSNSLKLVQEYVSFSSTDPNTTGLVRIIGGLKTALDEATKAGIVLKEQLKDLQSRFNDAMTEGFAKEQILLGEKDKLQQQVNETIQDYNELKALLRQTKDEQVNTLVAQLEEERANLKALNQELLKTKAELETAKNMLKSSQEELAKIKPPPDREVAAFKSDGEIILVDDQAKVVHLNIGSDNHVYPGLTFSVYDRNAPIPKDGKGKAEIEVSDVAKNFSAARILRSEIKRPILQGDIIANLIWDSDKTNVFVIAGDFDLNGDGIREAGAIDKIKALIEKWGGKVADTISVDTNYLVLGNQPLVLRKPTLEESELDPRAMERYETSLQRFNQYKEILSQAQTLWIPIFNYERFLYFVGRPGAF
jgi:ASC-1-like (ASCH) protein